jgi:hypothetical protein
LTRHLFSLISATAVLTAVSVVFCTTVSAHPFQQTRDTTSHKTDTIPHRTDTVGLNADMYARLRRAADSIRRQGDSVRRLQNDTTKNPTPPRTASPMVAALNDTTIHSKDTSKLDSLHWPIQDRRGDRFSAPNRNPWYLKDPPNLHDSIVYDPATRQFYIVEKIGNQYYRKPTYMTFEEMMKVQGDSSEDDYFRKRADAMNALNRTMRPKL